MMNVHCNNILLIYNTSFFLHDMRFNLLFCSSVIKSNYYNKYKKNEMNKIFLKNETLLPRRQATQGSMFNYSSFLVPYRTCTGVVHVLYLDEGSR